MPWNLYGWVSIPPSAVNEFGSFRPNSIAHRLRTGLSNDDVAWFRCGASWNSRTSTAEMCKPQLTHYFFGCIQKWIYREHLFRIWVVSRLLKTVVPNGHGVMVVCWICSTSMGQFVLKKKSNSCDFGGFGGCSFSPKVEPQRQDVMKTCREWTPRVSIWHISFAWSQTCQWISRPGGRFRYLGILFTSLDAGTWKDQRIGEGRWWEGIAASGKHGLKLFLGLDRPFSNKNRGSTKRYIGFRQLDMFWACFFFAPKKSSLGWGVATHRWWSFSQFGWLEPFAGGSGLGGRFDAWRKGVFSQQIAHRGNKTEGSVPMYWRFIPVNEGAIWAACNGRSICTKKIHILWGCFLFFFGVGGDPINRSYRYWHIEGVGVFGFR